MAGLRKYTDKRNFNESPEPVAKLRKSSGKLRFVVQRHAATRLHYDFRLEMDGVLKSWAVPKGPSLNPKDKRLAMMVEDHPYSYRTFEGTIPKGNYGAGEVEIWDEGYYKPLNDSGESDVSGHLLSELKNGNIKIILSGNKLNGEFALVKIKNSEEGNAWLLIKHKDAFAVTTRYDAESYVKPASKVSTLVQLKKEKGKLKKNMHFIKPMLATMHTRAFSDAEWLFEIKWDGYRGIAHTGDTIQLYSRNGISYLDDYPSITKALKQQKHSMVLDGEIVAYNENGLPSFQCLQHAHQHTQVIYHVFDLLFLNGHDTKELSLLQRKELLQSALTEGDSLKYCDHILKEGKSFFAAAIEKNLEGIMAKKQTSKYFPGLRSLDWIKIKTSQTATYFIIGYTQPTGSRTGFGALLLGEYNEEGEMIYKGHVGSGFSEKTLAAILTLLKPLVIPKPALRIIPKTNTPAKWVEPYIRCKVKFSETTNAGVLRHPVFVELIEDNKAPKVGNGIRKTSSQKNVLVTNSEKIYWPDDKLTKGDLISYYEAVSKWIVPHLKGRPQSLHRFPNGIYGEHFYHKDAGDTAPEWVATSAIFSESAHKSIQYIVCNNEQTLLYLANLGCIEMNPWASTVQNLDLPTYLVIDLDPSANNTFAQVKEAALAVKTILDVCKCDGYCKTSGASGLHIFVPLANKFSYEQVRLFAQLIAIKLVEALPDTTTIERSLEKRNINKIYVDFLQNRKGQTISSVYSVRPLPHAPVSTPLLWQELKTGIMPQDFTMKNLPERLSTKGDIFKPVLGKGINIRKALVLLEKVKL